MTSSVWEQQVREALALRDEFLSVVAHELRSPIASLQLGLERILRRASAGSKAPFDNELICEVERALRQSERLTLLVQNLLDVSRIRAGELELDLEPFDLGALVREIVDGRRELAARVGCELSLGACEAALGQWDRTRLEQVVENLLSNALKYGAGQPINVELSSDGQRARLSVRDRGIGIAEEDRVRIFEPFERAASAWRTQSLGLGLYIVRAIVDAHGGAIAVDSAPGQGATFIVELPVRAEPRAAAAGESGDVFS